MSMQLNSDQLDTLKQFSEENGRNWKSKLRELWSTGKDEHYKLSDGTAVGAILRQVRNDFGPDWLGKVNLAAQTACTTFRDMEVGAHFDWIDDSRPGQNSYFTRCIKTGERTYSELGETGPVGDPLKVSTDRAEVFHVGLRFDAAYQMPKEGFAYPIGEALSAFEGFEFAKAYLRSVSQLKYGGNLPEGASFEVQDIVSANRIAAIEERARPGAPEQIGLREAEALIKDLPVAEAAYQAYLDRSSPDSLHWTDMQGLAGKAVIDFSMKANERLLGHQPIGFLKEAWKELGNVEMGWVAPDDEACYSDEEIAEPFLHFSPGTHREDIWRWMEEQNPEFRVGEVMQGVWPATLSEHRAKDEALVKVVGEMAEDERIALAVDLLADGYRGNDIGAVLRVAQLKFGDACPGLTHDDDPLGRESQALRLIEDQTDACLHALDSARTADPYVPYRDMEHVVEINGNYPADKGNALLMKRVDVSLSAPEGLSCIGGVDKRWTPEGEVWRVDLHVGENPITGGDCVEVGEYASHETAIQALWLNRDQAYTILMRHEQEAREQGFEPEKGHSPLKL